MIVSAVVMPCGGGRDGLWLNRIDRVRVRSTLMRIGSFGHGLLIGRFNRSGLFSGIGCSLCCFCRFLRLVFVVVIVLGVNGMYQEYSSQCYKNFFHLLRF